jgi:hypothetical protein
LTVHEIKAAVDRGEPVRWKSENYHVIRDRIGEYLIVCQNNQSTIGLTHQDGVTLNGDESDFYVADCEDAPDGRHEITADLEYDPSGQSRSCEHCGRTIEQIEANRNS